MSDLKNCPFCGGPAAFRGAAIRCTSFACNASLSPVWTTAEIRKAKGDHAEKLRIAIEQTAERWNRREAADMAECAAFFAGYEAGEAGRADLAAPSAPDPDADRLLKEALFASIEPNHSSPLYCGVTVTPMTQACAGVFYVPRDWDRATIKAWLGNPQGFAAPSAPAEVEGLTDAILARMAELNWKPASQYWKEQHDAKAAALTAQQAEIERLRAIAGQLADALHTADTIIADYTDIASEGEQQEIDAALAAYAKLKGDV